MEPFRARRNFERDNSTDNDYNRTNEMKRFLSLIFLGLCLSTFPLVTGMTCSQSQQTITYNSLFSVGQAVNQAYAAYMDQVVAGTAKFDVSVAKAYNDFQAAFLVAVNSAQTINAPAPANIQNLANAVYAAIAQFKK